MMGIDKIVERNAPGFNLIYWVAVSLWFSAAALKMVLTPLAGDETYYFYFSQFMTHGGHFFDKFWVEDKPGGMQFLYLIATPFKSGLWNFFSIRFFTIGYQAGTIAAFYMLTKRIFAEHIGAAKLLLPIFILLYLNPLVEGQFSNGDNFVVLWILLAAHFFLSARHLLSALAIGISFCLKQNTALEVMPSSLTIMAKELFGGGGAVWLRFLRSFKLPLKQLAVFFVPIAVIFAYAILLGTAENFLNLTFLDRIRSHITYKNYDFAVRYGLPILKQTAVLWAGMIAYLGFFAWKALRGQGMLRGGVYFYVFVWVVFASISVWVGGYFFPHYFIEIVPILIVAAAVFMLEAGAFWPLITYSGAALVSFTWAAAAVAAIVFSVFLFIEYRRPGLRAMLRLSLVFVSLLFSMQSNPFLSAVEVAGSRDPLRYYSPNDKDVLNAAKYLQGLNAESVFVYDYTMEIYCLAGLTSGFGYAAKHQYINFSELIKDNLNYSSQGAVLAARRKELATALENGDFQYVAVNYNAVLAAEVPQMAPLLRAMSDYEVLRNFGGVWVYRRTGVRKDTSNRGYRIASAGIDPATDEIFISVTRDAFAANISADLRCGDLVWHYPENGIIFPMRADQDRNNLWLRAAARGYAGGECSLELGGILANQGFPKLAVKPAMYAGGK